MFRSVFGQVLSQFDHVGTARTAVVAPAFERVGYTAVVPSTRRAPRGIGPFAIRRIVSVPVPTTSSPVFVDEIGKAAGWTAISKLGYRLSRIGAGVLASVSLKNVIQPTLIVRVP